MLPKLNLVSAVASVVLFFLPWLSIECSGERMATQSGLQTITGRATPAQEPEPAGLRVNYASEESLGHSYLAGVALLSTGIAAVLAFMALGSGRTDLTRFSGGLCAGALACLLLQTALGFPVKRTMQKALEENQHPEMRESPFRELNDGLANEIIGRFRVTPLPWFYLQLFLLSIPSAIFINGLLDRMKAAAGQRD